MNISDKGIKLIKHFEGYKNKPYKCSARVWTIGIGSAMYHEQLRMKLQDRDQYPLRPEDNRIWSDEEIISLFKKILGDLNWELLVLLLFLLSSTNLMHLYRSHLI